MLPRFLSRADEMLERARQLRIDESDRVRQRYLLELTSYEQDSYSCYDDTSYGHEYGFHAAPALDLQYCRKSWCEHLLAVGFEEGKVRLLDSRRVRDNSAVISDVQFGKNAIFALAWIPRSSLFIVGTGDQNAIVYDVESEQRLYTAEGHYGSVRSIAVLSDSDSAQDGNVFATGARDGCINLYDRRLRKSAPFHTIDMPHDYQTAKRRSSRADSKQSVTALCFYKRDQLISTGLPDSQIRFWDLRQMGRRRMSSAGRENIAQKSFREISYRGPSSSNPGYSCLLLGSGNRLYAPCRDNVIYSYALEEEPVLATSVFAGATLSSFYIKSALSASGDFLATGSSDCKIYVFDTADPDKAPVMLEGHRGETNAVAWNSLHPCQLASGDDSSIRFWRPQRDYDDAFGEQSAVERHKIGFAKRDPRSLEERSPHGLKRSQDNDSSAAAAALQSSQAESANKTPQKPQKRVRTLDDWVQSAGRRTSSAASAVRAALTDSPTSVLSGQNK